jgi:PadR family transcriptional regulator PadR
MVVDNVDIERGDLVPPRFLGEFEQMVLLAILQLRGDAYAVSVLRELDIRVGRSVSRGTLYKTLERLETKGLVAWALEDGAPERGGHPRRRFTVTAQGAQALHESRAALLKLWEGLEGAEGEAST